MWYCTMVQPDVTMEDTHSTSITVDYTTVPHIPDNIPLLVMPASHHESPGLPHPQLPLEEDGDEGNLPATEVETEKLSPEHQLAYLDMPLNFEDTETSPGPLETIPAEDPLTNLV